MKAGDVGVAHGPNWVGVFELTDFRLIKPGLITKSDHWEYGEFRVFEDGQFDQMPIFVQRLDAQSREAAELEVTKIWNLRNSPPKLPAASSKEAKQARESVLGKTDFAKVLEAIKGKDPERAAKLFGDISAALSNEPHEDDKASVVRLRKLLTQRKSGLRSWHFQVVAHWDELPKHYGEISLWLERHGERGVSTAAIAKFMQRLVVKAKETTK